MSTNAKQFSWEPLIERALTGASVSTVFQPIVDLTRGQVVGFEAFSRFDDEEGPRVGPHLWFAAARRLGRAAELEAVTLAQALAHRPDLPPNCFLSVNMEPESLWATAVAEVLDAAGELSKVVVEITDLRDTELGRLEPGLQRLREAGASIAMDAGASQAGLRQMLELRPSVIKLDRALVTNIDSDEARAALVEMVGLFARRINARILAEGVETGAEARRLMDLGIELAQGYLFARPGPGFHTDVPEASRLLAGAHRSRGATAHHLVEELPSGDRPLSDGWVPVIDDDGRPRGVRQFTRSEVIPTLVINVNTSPGEIGSRVSTATSAPGLPVIVVDDLGRVLGLISMRRLIGHLAAYAR